MAFRASNVVPQEAYRLVKSAAVQLKRNVQQQINDLAAKNATFEDLRGIYRTLERANAQFNNLKSTPGLADYAKAQEDDATYDVAAEFTAMQNEIAGAIGWMDANIPTSITAKSPSQWGDGPIIATEFTPTQTAGLRTELQKVVDSIS